MLRIIVFIASLGLIVSIFFLVLERGNRITASGKTGGDKPKIQAILPPAPFSQDTTKLYRWVDENVQIAVVENIGKH